MTSIDNGVMFDCSGNGHPQQLSWTSPRSSNGWLVFDGNGNGLIDDAREMFGNITEQPTSSNPNGFRALAVFDLSANGGNNDGVIDAQDVIWTKLRVWIDENQDGISQRTELHSLKEVGIRAIRLQYQNSTFTDRYGNEFRYKGKPDPIKGDDVDRSIYDVFLQSKQ